MPSVTLCHYCTCAIYLHLHRRFLRDLVLFTLYSKILLQEGHEVIACDVRQGDGLEKLVHLGATTMVLDVTDPKSIATLEEAVRGMPIDNLLNVAGTSFALQPVSPNTHNR